MGRSGMRAFSRGLAFSAALFLLALPGSGFGQKKEPVTLKYSWINTPMVAPFFVGMEKGFFDAEGIDLTWEDGRGSVNNLQLLGSKKILFGFVDASTAAQYISQGLDVKVVWCFLQTSPMGVIAREDSGIKTLKDLEGRKIGAAPADSGKALFPAVAELNGVDMSRVHFVNVTPAARNTALLNGDVEAIIAYFADNVPFLRSKGGKVNYMRYVDSGVNLLGMSVGVHNTVFEEKPDTLRRLIRALNKSVSYSQAFPEQAVAAIQKRSPVTVKDADVALEIVRNSLSLVHTANTWGMPIGWMAKRDWEQTVELLKKYGNLKNPLPLARYYTNDFLPAKPTF